MNLKLNCCQKAKATTTAMPAGDVALRRELPQRRRLQLRLPSSWMNAKWMCVTMTRRMPTNRKCGSAGWGGSDTSSADEAACAHLASRSSPPSHQAVPEWLCAFHLTLFCNNFARDKDGDGDADRGSCSGRDMWAIESGQKQTCWLPSHKRTALQPHSPLCRHKPVSALI